VATRELDTSTDPELGTLARDLQPPIEAIVEALSRFTLARVGTETQTAPDLVWRARHLADELTQVVTALAATPADPIDGRAPHTTVLVRNVIARAADSCAERLGTRRVVVRCSAQLAITTQPNRLHELLVTAIDEAARRHGPNTDIRITAQRRGNRLVIEIEGGVVAGTGIETLHHLVRAVGGRIEVLAGPQTRAALRFHIPQGRVGDLDELPDDVA
jgi:K+-sensing histidine kinase KdpD